MSAAAVSQRRHRGRRLCRQRQRRPLLLLLHCCRLRLRLLLCHCMRDASVCCPATWHQVPRRHRCCCVTLLRRRSRCRRCCPAVGARSGRPHRRRWGRCGGRCEGGHAAGQALGSWPQLRVLFWPAVQRDFLQPGEWPGAGRSGVWVRARRLAVLGMHWARHAFELHMHSAGSSAAPLLPTPFCAWHVI